MKWQLLLLLLALAAVTFAMTGAEYSPAHMEEYSLVEQEAEADIEADADAEMDEEMDMDEEAEMEEEFAEPASFVEIPKIAKPPKGMDPFVAKHYKKGFYGGRFGRPNLDSIRVPAAHVEARLVEDCMACRFVWKQVEMDIGNIEFQKTIYDAFMNQCRRGMTAPIMYTPCQTMFHSLDDMITGYSSGLSVEEICAQAKMCR